MKKVFPTICLTIKSRIEEKTKWVDLDVPTNTKVSTVLTKAAERLGYKEDILCLIVYKNSDDGYTPLPANTTLADLGIPDNAMLVVDTV